MRLRTTALIAGLLGVIALVAGLVAQAQRPESTVTVPATVDTAAVIVPADMIAFAGEGRYAVEGEGTLKAFAALPSDMEAWAADKEVTYVTGMPTWEGLTVTVAEPSPSPTPSVSASESAEPNPSPSASEGEDGPQYESLLGGSNDHWRDSWTGTDRLSVGAVQVEAGLDVVFVSEDGSPLSSIDLKLSREVNDAWITPLIVWGGVLTAVGFLALILLIVDVRPVQARAEEWVAHRQRIGAGDEGPKPGSRRARRLQGATIPEAEIAAEADGVDAAVQQDAVAPPAPVTPGSAPSPVDTAAPQSFAPDIFAPAQFTPDDPGAGSAFTPDDAGAGSAATPDVSGDLLAGTVAPAEKVTPPVVWSVPDASSPTEAGFMPPAPDSDAPGPDATDADHDQEEDR